ncbi:MAG: site-specific integrase [Dehalococcoidia bacterium]|nr:site-specific integrase [Dehalococcoidia bacterium]
MTGAPLKDFMGHLQAERHVSRYTARNYSRDIGEFLSFIQQREIVPAEAATREMVREYLVWLSQRGIVRASIARKLSALRTFYRYLKQEGRVESSPMSLVASPKKEKRLPGFLSSNEVSCQPAATRGAGVGQRRQGACGAAGCPGRPRPG